MNTIFNSFVGKTIRWLIFLPLFFILVYLLKLGLGWVQLWVKPQLQQDGFAAYIAWSIFLSVVWLPIPLIYAVFTSFFELFVPRPKTGATIAATLYIPLALLVYFSGYPWLFAFIAVDIILAFAFYSIFSGNETT